MFMRWPARCVGTALALACMVACTASAADEPSRAQFLDGMPYVSFWQRGAIGPASQGWCSVELEFDGSTLAASIQGLVVGVRALDRAGHPVKGLAVLQLGTLAESNATRRVSAVLDGVDVAEWREIVSETGASPLCARDARIVVESATGTQNGNAVDLVRSGQLRYTKPRVLDVTVAAPTRGTKGR